MADVRARQITRIASAAELPNVLQTSVLPRKIAHMPIAKKETDCLGWFYLFEYHILGMLDILKQLKHLVKF